METIYTVSRSSDEKNTWNRPYHAVISLSKRNIIAFSSAEKLDSKKSEIDEISNQYYVYVCDAEQPWSPHQVAACDIKVTKLIWDSSGTRLLVVDQSGLMKLWSMKEFLLNDWECVAETNCCEGEEIVTATWLHTGLMINLHSEKRDSALYSDKYIRAKFNPSLRSFGSTPMEGWVAVSSTNMVYLCVLKKSNDNTITVVTEQCMLGIMRDFVATADIGFDPSGTIHVTTSDSSTKSSIQCYQLSLSMTESGLQMHCTSDISLFSQLHTNPLLTENPDSRVMLVKFGSHTNPSLLYICTGDKNMSYIEVWSMKTQNHVLHRFFQTANTPDTNLRMSKWRHSGSLTINSAIITLALSEFPIMPVGNETPPISMDQHIAVGCSDGSVKLCNKLQVVAEMKCDTKTVVKGNKKQRSAAYPSSLVQTFSGCGLVMIDTNNTLYMLRIVNMKNPALQTLPLNIVTKLELAIVGGYDWWDVLLAVTPSIIEAVVQRLTDNFHKQPASVQDILLTRFLAVKASLYQCSSSSQQKASDCYCKMVLTTIHMAFRSMLRPKSLAGVDKTPAEQLTNACSKTTEIEIDKIVVTLESTDFVVEPGTLISLQHLIQWVADFTLYLLSSVPLYQNYSLYPGSTIVQDANCLMMIREMLILIKMWGLVCHSCLPEFTLSSKVDCLSRLFHLTSRLWLSIKDGGSFDLDESVMDECCLLPSQAVIPPVDIVLPTTKNHLNITSCKQTEYFSFGDAPRGTDTSPWYSLIEGGSVTKQKRDIIRQISLGVRPPQCVKQCSRCGSQALLKGNAKSMASKSWDQRWVKMCYCGGHWMLSNSKQSV
ncbi:unnamed protein product [Owenia fusiformis]|uniref:Mediator of RNA polymerase II transcription subunit 16 n=1 Tax=Owenia fusiformis TaxID=6347 RepID=A0A8J1XKW3_OWEFU|nr:unnamed protein product [Owenia fusiformis]CAH1776893.1 unnamed protein product [Owenia fusiformis]